MFDWCPLANICFEYGFTKEGGRGGWKERILTLENLRRSRIGIEGRASLLIVALRGV